MEGRAPVLEVAGLTKRFGGLVVNRDISLVLAPGARHALIGPNGAGKTTLVGILSGAIRHDAGSIAIFGHDVTRDGPAQRTKRGLVRTFQVSSLFVQLSVLENIFLEGFQPSGPFCKGVEGLVAARRLTNSRPVAISDWDRDSEQEMQWGFYD